MAQPPKLNGIDNDESAAGYAGFKLAREILSMLVERNAFTGQAVGMLLMNAASFEPHTPNQQAAQRLVLDLVGTYMQVKSRVCRGPAR